MGDRGYQDENGLYQLPNDSTEHARLERQSDALVAVLNDRPFHAQVKYPRRILDVGCGTGAMTYRLAEKFPDALVIGVDLAKVPGGDRPKRDNVEFFQGNYQDLIGRHEKFAPASFDYIYSRLLVLGIDDWPAHLSKMASLLAEDGWLELHELTIMRVSRTGQRTFAKFRCYQEWTADAHSKGLDLVIGEKLAGLVQAVPGLELKVNEVYKVPSDPTECEPRVAPASAQVEGLFIMVSRKMGKGRRSERENEELAKEWHDLFKQGHQKGDYYPFVILAAQKKDSV